ncbi:hypothetical protein TSUD_31010 [Trifolium subterraneum]|uniref:Uncharacterized protein n=1 Tax=Trifolium subterraneum TaxID=3900 RepID=A0A2Z6N9E3_TRISU|nr:hypothetical protein TSUD_31010 [Trifolium subterraneum]
MSIEGEQSQSNFKQLISYFLIEQFLLCSPDPKKPRVSSWGMVEDMNAFEEVNWANAIYDNICESFEKLKAALHEVHKQHYFHGCAPVFEVIIFKRIKPLAPNANPSFAYLPIESYKPKRDRKPLEMLKASEITPCSYYGDGVEAASSPSPSSLIPTNVAENFLASGAESDLVSSFVDICIDDASSQPSSPMNDAHVNDAQSSVTTSLPRRSSRSRKQVKRYSPKK